MRRMLLGTLVVATVAGAAACGDMVVPDFNNPTPGDIAGDPVAGLQLAATGILREDRAPYATWVNDAASFGREGMDYFPTDGRAYTHFVAQNPLDPAGFAQGGGSWTSRYRNQRNVFNFLGAIDNATGLNDAQKNASRGFAKTYQALSALWTVVERHNLGAITEIKADPRELAPFVARDSAYNFVIGTLDEAAADLAAAGTTAFPFQLHAGFTTNGTFNTPVTFLQFNRALAARAEVYRASLRNPACGANGITCYQRALTALAASFVSTTEPLTKGVYYLYSTESGDVQNGLNAAVDPHFLAHPSNETDAPLKANGQRDDRYTAKIRTLATPRSHVGNDGPTTSIGFNVFPTNASPAALIRNEELILLRAEARYFTGDVVGALADINHIRTTAGGLAPRGPFLNDDDFITELLLQRRYSLLFEGHRWVDVRRFNRMSTLPLDRSTHFYQSQQPIPQAECLSRAGTSTPCP